MFNNVIPTALLKKILDEIPKQYDLPLETPVEYDIPKEFITGVACTYTKTEENTGVKNKITYSVDHPVFQTVRDQLSNTGYIHKETGWWNGDRVLKPFRLNSIWFQEGDMFPCADAMRNKLQIAEEGVPTYD